MLGTNRHRDRSRLAMSVPWKVKLYRTSDEITGTTTYSHIEQMWDVEDPNWREKRYQWIRYGKHLPVNNMRKIEDYFEEVPSFHYTACNNSLASCTSNPTYNVWWEAPWNGPGFTMVDHSGPGCLRPRFGTETFWGNPQFTDFSESERNALLQKALANARTASWDVGTFLAEFHKTARMIRGVGKGVVDRTERIMSRRSIKTFDDFFSAWLEYRYGWRILYYDIMEANESLLRLRGLNPLHSRYTAYDSKTTSHTGRTSRITASTSSCESGYTSPVRVILDTSHEVSTELRAGVGLDLNAEKLAFMDPLVTISEIIPYHLVVNWFINSKELVEAWSPFAHGEVVYGFLTEIRTRRRSASPHSVTFSGSGIGSNHHLRLSRYVTGGSIVRKETIRTKQEPVMNLRFRLNFKPENVLDAIGIVLLSRTKLFRKLRPR